MELLNALNWRYATKKMNGEAVSEENVKAILDAIQLAPTSSGLQPFKVLVITNKELKEKIQPIAYGQSQIVDASHLLVFAARKQYTKEYIDSVYANQDAKRGLPAGSSDAYKNTLIDMYTNQTAEQNFVHTARQAYIAFGVGIAAAAELKVDATPMEGFVNAQLDELLNLEEQGLSSVTILALGKRDEQNDWLVNLDKVRLPKEELFIQID